MMQNQLPHPNFTEDALEVLLSDTGYCGGVVLGAGGYCGYTSAGGKRVPVAPLLLKQGVENHSREMPA